MRFTDEQHFPAPADSVLALYSSPDFFTSLAPTERLATPTLVAHSADGDRVRLELRFRFIGDLPSGAGRFVQRDKLTWVERTTIDCAARTSSSQLVADDYPLLLDASATASFTSDGPKSSTRRVEGVLKVRVPLVGGRVERAIVDGLRDHLAAERDAAAAALGG